MNTKGTAMKHEYNTRKIKFTLVELLVVITIISILAGLLLPTLKKARDAAHTTACKSNSRQLGMSFMGYEDAWNGYFPTREWPKHTFRYSGLPDRRWTRGIFFCPAYREPEAWTWNYCYTPAYSIKGTYGYNYVYLYADQSHFVGKMHQVKVASHFAVSMDSKWLTRDACNSSVYWGTNPPYDRTYPGNRHDGGANVLFADTSVRRILRDDLLGWEAAVKYWLGR